MHCINLGALADMVHQYIFLCPFQFCLTLPTPPSLHVSCSFCKHVFLFHLFIMRCYVEGLSEIIFLPYKSRNTICMYPIYLSKYHL
ncbi:hypothetical protein MTR67_011451 [Solanum verrucosum]|uniref:Uncharacterized protein n=1 Tax=Solanum verrucosum TaxID=315347 RepID=A0AAF0TG54_SOLVR|nr:hypothetical protein MTR67_011451 [Solanum verrucosum]